jgi:hypothetical protein
VTRSSRPLPHLARASPHRSGCSEPSLTKIGRRVSNSGSAWVCTLVKHRRLLLAWSATKSIVPRGLASQPTGMAEAAGRGMDVANAVEYAFDPAMD